MAFDGRLHGLRWQTYFWAAGVFWTVAAATVVAYDVSREYARTKEMALKEARAIAARDRHWTAVTGMRLFAPAGDLVDTPKIPAEMKMDTIVTFSGDQLVQVSPMHLSRKVYDMSASDQGITTRLISAHPTKPANGPDPWEAGALGDLDRGAPEVSTFRLDGAAPILRYVAPLRTESTCLQCHNRPGTVVGSLRGAITLTLPLAPLLTLTQGHIRTEIFGVGLLWLIGLAGLSIAGTRFKRRIEERDRAEDALRTSEERLRLLIESTDDVVLMQDLDGRFLYYNPASYYGAGTSDIVGKRPDEILEKKSADELMDRLREVVLTGKPTEHEESIHWRGETLWFHAKRYPVRDAHGVVRSISLFSRNITEQKRAEERLRQAEERLKLEQLRTRIAADLHDDIGSTLSSMSIFSAMLGQQIPPELSTAGRMLHRIQENLRNVQESLHDIVWTINPENDALDNIILRMEEFATEVIEARGISLHLVVPEAQGPVIVPMQLRRYVYLIFKEAINNVVTHSDCREVTVEIVTDGHSLQIMVADDGKGFEPGKVPGGDGVSNMKKRAATLGGTCEVHSRPGKGTTVTVRIPIA
jgi:PAS domain S-box-containing protein